MNKPHRLSASALCLINFPEHLSSVHSRNEVILGPPSPILGITLLRGLLGTRGPALSREAMKVNPLLIVI
jgi:hypothetical protein